MLTRQVPPVNTNIRTTRIAQLLAAREVVRQQTRVVWYRIEANTYGDWRVYEAGSGRELTNYPHLSVHSARAWAADKYPHALEVEG